MQIEVTALILVKKVFVVIRNVVRIVPASKRERYHLHYVTVFLSIAILIRCQSCLQ